MGLKESNPIQQRMELLVEKWEAAIKDPEVKLVRIRARDNEKDMVNTFYTYLLGVDTDNHDIPIIFNSIYHSHHQYSNALLAEMQDMIDDWNASSKDNVDVVMKQLDWEIDPKLAKQDNAAFLFIQNINNLAKHLNLQQGIYFVPILRVSFTRAADINNWLNLAIKAGISPSVKLVVDDTFSNPFYDEVVEKNPGQVATLIPDLDMDKAMQQIASMGSPNDPAVQYRKAFMAMMQAIEKRKEGDAEKQAAACIEIANKNLIKNPYWIGQVIAVNAALANDQVGYKNFKKAINYASRGVKAAEDAKEIITDEFVLRKFIAQAIMIRASLYAADKDWQNAINDFTTAAGHYVYTNDMILAMEAYRMMGFSNDKAGNRDAACKALNEALIVSDKIPSHIIRFTTFAGIIELLMGINNFKYISNQEVEEAAKEVYGDEWMNEIKNWKNPHYEQVTEPADAMT